MNDHVLVRGSKAPTNLVSHPHRRCMVCRKATKVMVCRKATKVMVCSFRSTVTHSHTK